MIKIHYNKSNRVGIIKSACGSSSMHHSLCHEYMVKDPAQVTCRNCKRMVDSRLEFIKRRKEVVRRLRNVGGGYKMYLIYWLLTVTYSQSIIIDGRPPLRMSESWKHKTEKSCKQAMAKFEPRVGKDIKSIECLKETVLK